MLVERDRRTYWLATVMAIALSLLLSHAQATRYREETQHYSVGVVPTECGANVMLSAEVCFDVLPTDVSISLYIKETSPASQVGGPIRALVEFEGAPSWWQFWICDQWENAQIYPGSTKVKVSITSGNCGADITELPGLVVQGEVRAVFASS